MRILLSLVLCALGGCIVKYTDTGVDNTWRDPSIPAFERGITMQAEVVSALGPPSQLIDLGDRTVFYYLRQHSKTSSVILLLYNDTRTRITYDRAIFFFDGAGVLEEYAFSKEELEHEPASES